MRVFYDANAILSVLLWPGFTLRVHERLVERGAEGITSERVLTEVLDVAARKLTGADPAFLDAMEHEIRHAWTLVPSTDAEATVHLRDPDDEGVLADAEQARADILLTGDRDLTDVADSIRSLAVLSPRQVHDEILGG